MPVKTASTAPPKARKGAPNALPPAADVRPVAVCEATEYLDPRDLVPLERNPRTISDERRTELARSLRDLGLFRPLLVWRAPDGPVVIGGNQKLPILQQMASDGSPFVLRDGTRTPGVPVTWFEGDEARARTVALRDNNADGDWDTAGLAEYLRELGEMGVGTDDLALTGFDSGLLADLAQSYQTASEPAPAGPQGEAPAVPAPSPASAPEPAPGPQPGAPAAPAGPTAAQGAGALSDPAEQQVGVVIGHVRGKIKAPTYERLIKALTEGLANGIPEGGLDAAFGSLLDRLGRQG